MIKVNCYTFTCLSKHVTDIINVEWRVDILVVIFNLSEVVNVGFVVCDAWLVRQQQQYTKTLAHPHISNSTYSTTTKTTSHFIFTIDSEVVMTTVKDVDISADKYEPCFQWTINNYVHETYDFLGKRTSHDEWRSMLRNSQEIAKIFDVFVWKHDKKLKREKKIAWNTVVGTRVL